MFSITATTVLEFLKEFGPLIGLIFFFIWRDWKREERLSTRVEALEAYQRETLVGLLKNTTVALTHNSECLKWIGRIIERKWRDIPDQPERHDDVPC